MEKPETKDRIDRVKQVQFSNAINIGGQTVTGVEVSRYKMKIDRLGSGLLIKREGWPDLWVPDANINWVVFE